MQRNLLLFPLLILLGFSCSNSDNRLSPKENEMLDAFNSRNYEEAIRLAEELFKEDPNNPKPLLVKGRSQSGLGRFEDALQSLNKAITIEPKYSEAYLYRALVYHELKDFSRGKEDLQFLLKEEPENAHYLEFYAHNRYRAKDYSEAIVTYEKLIKQIPDDIDLYIYSAGANREAKQFDAAISDLQKALHIDSTSSFANEVLGDVFSNQKRYELAVKQFSLGIKYMPEDELPVLRANIYASRGYAFLNSGKVELATIDTDTSIHVFPNASAYRNKALIALQNNNTEEVCEYLELAQKYDASTNTAAQIQELVKEHYR